LVQESWELTASKIGKRMEEFFVSNMWGIGLILFGPTLYLYLNIIKVDKNLIGFIFGPFIFLPPIIGFFMVVSHTVFGILAIAGFSLVVLLFIWMYFSDKKEKAINRKRAAIDKYINENNIDDALEIAFSLPNGYALKDHTIVDIVKKVAESNVTKALEITEDIKDTEIQSYTLKNIASQVALNSVNEALNIAELIKDEKIKDEAVRNITDIKKDG